MVDDVLRRLLSALAGSTPAFSGPARSEYGSGPRRLLSALAGSAPAFTPEPTGDRTEFTDTRAVFGHRVDHTAPPGHTGHNECPGADEDLSTAVTAAAQGDRAALTTIVESIRPLIVRYTRARFARTDTGPDPDDLAQEILLSVVTALPRYTAQGRPFLAFVYGIAAHRSPRPSARTPGRRNRRSRSRRTFRRCSSSERSSPKPTRNSAVSSPPCPITSARS
ncbi:sigma factor [Nocardia brasiliensis]|uniref:sigma factor n=1 Tax=Nocardia brasiliensis TaxID=37326 RepID=UPI003CC7D6B7